MDHQGFDYKEYLGDSVYAAYDGYSVCLTTENGYPDDPRNRIVLEEAVLFALFAYWDSCRMRDGKNI